MRNRFYPAINCLPRAPNLVLVGLQKILLDHLHHTKKTFQKCDKVNGIHRAK